MLEVKGISYRYPSSPWLFRHLSLRIMPGEIVGISGYSGSGKSTMAQIIGGYLKPDEGTILIDGQAIPIFGFHPVQLVWQHPERAINPKWRMKQIFEESGGFDQKLLASLGIKSEWLERWPRELSGGELQRFCLARALVGDVKYLVADEMTTMLDAITQAQMWHAVKRLAKERNIGVLAISHDQHLLKRVSDRIINFTEIN
ncbi:ATP-binding cassette domain-containing protein [Virgibacillus sp. C22-A2]|uniref:ATP-binding cassette domain-containing protein n=1 Tax=Virgibacillus tibetensis TaxID=3042313 RepID=A0ABU6KEA1_9BACI|nr:ATP-binding cassette domain-containing protein [Virgibacillus sp. C22-A2]